MKRIFFILAVVIFIFIIQNLFHSIFSLWQKQELLVKAKNELELEKKENQQLKEEISLVKEPSFIEAQARDKLLMTKPGEQIVITEDKPIVKKTLKREAEAQKANWLQWWELFFP